MRSIAGVSNDNGTAQQHHSTQVSKLLTWLIQVWDDTTKNRSDCAGRRQTELRSLNAVCYPHKNRYEFLRSYVTENRQLLRQRRTTCEGLQCANATPHPQYRYWTPTAHKRADLYHHRQFNYTSGTSQALQTSAHAKLQDAATWRIELHDPRASVRLLWMFHDDRSDVNVDSAR